MSEKFYAVKTWSDLDDWDETTIERKLYRTREEAERRAEEVEAWSSDEMHYGARVVEFEVLVRLSGFLARAVRCAGGVPELPRPARRALGLRA